MIILVLLVLILGVFIYYFLFLPKIKTIQINNTKINIEVVDSGPKREKGLSGREKLQENQGMLFIFQDIGYHSFWMKEMNFSLDFIWIRNNKIVEITENVKPEDYQPPKTLISKTEVDSVLEVNSGFCKKNNIKIGDELVYN